MDIANLLSWKLPGARWSLKGESYAGLEWERGNQVAKPSEAELAAWWLEYVANRDGLAYRERRAAEYVALMAKVPNNRDPLQTIGDQFDVIWSCLESLAGGGGLTAEAVRMLQIRAEIKARHPKP